MLPHHILSRISGRSLGRRPFNTYQKGFLTRRRDTYRPEAYHQHFSCRLFASSRAGKRRRNGRRPLPDVNENKKIMFQSLGCPRNFVDTEVMLGISVQSGQMDLTQEIDEADYLVVNTCGFLESAREESRLAIEEMIQGKKANSKLLVTGCMVNLYKDEILADYPEIDAVLASGAVDKVMETIQSLDAADNHHHDTDEGSDDENKTTRTLVKSSKRRSFLEQGDTPRFLATPPHYAYMKISEGCKKQCAFCIIPKIKGRLRSKPIPQLVEEFRALVEYGASEIILIAQDLGDYGKDLKQSSSSSSSSSSSVNLEMLLRELLNALKEEDHHHQDLWLRLLYLYPDEITPELLDIIESDPRICRYLDMPIQHSHNDMLKLMRRKTTSEDIQKTIQTLRARLPDIHIRTSLMVGFPGETEEHFEHLLNFVTEYELENVGVFMYSNEEKAYSSRLPDHVPEEVKQERYDRLMRAQLEIIRRKNQAKIDTKERLEVVVEGLQNDQIVGRYYGQCPDIDGQVILEPGNNTRIYPGERYWVELTGFDDYDLIGTVVDGPKEVAR